MDEQFSKSHIDIRFYPNYYNIKGEKCITTLNEFTFTCSKGIEWTVPVNFESDAASIPKWAQKFIGEPLEGDTLRAVLVHDVYCVNKERSQKDTHRVFKEIMKIDGVNLFTRNLMHLAVSKWNKIKNPYWN